VVQDLQVTPANGRKAAKGGRGRWRDIHLVGEIDEKNPWKKNKGNKWGGVIPSVPTM